MSCLCISVSAVYVYVSVCVSFTCVCCVLLSGGKAKTVGEMAEDICKAAVASTYWIEAGEWREYPCVLYYISLMAMLLLLVLLHVQCCTVSVVTGAILY